VSGALVAAAAASAAALAVPRRGSALERLRPRADDEKTLSRRLAVLADPRALPRRVVGPAGAATGYLLGGPVLAALFGVGALIGVRALARRKERRAADDRRRAVVDVAAALAAELRAGQPPAAALGAASDEGGNLSRRLADVAAVAAQGGEAVPGLEQLALTTGAEGLRAVACCWQVAAGTGAGLADALDATSLALERREQDRRDLDARLAGSRATASVLVLLPVFGVAMAQALGAGAVDLLLHTVAGGLLLGAAAALDAAGWWWTARIVGRATRP
jgi:tight adherence protein B